MGDFFVQPPGVLPPPDIPTPEIPAADFKTAARLHARGLKEGDFFGNLWNGLLAIIQAIVADILFMIEHGAADLCIFFLNILGQAREKAEPAFQNVIAATLYALFGIKVNVGPLGPGTGAGSREGVSAAVSGAILGSLVTPVSYHGNAALRPSDRAAREWLSRITGIGIEGWIEGLLADALSVHELEQLGSLKDVLFRALGVGRLSRRVMGPPLKVLVADPFTWLLNKAYRPTLFGVSEAIQARQRHLWVEEQTTEELARHGLTDEKIGILETLALKEWTVQLLDYGIATGAINSEDARKDLEVMGWTSEKAFVILQHAQWQRMRPFYESMVTDAKKRYLDREIDPATFQAILEQAGIDTWEIQAVMTTAGLQRSLNVKLLSLREIGDAMQHGILTIADYQARASQLGYSFEDAITLELLELAREKKVVDADKLRAERLASAAAAAATKHLADLAKAAAIAAAAPDKGVSLQNYQKLVKGGLRTLQQYTTYLAGIGVAAGDIPALVELLNRDMGAGAASGAAAGGLRAAGAAKGISVSQEEAAVLRGVQTLAEYEAFLSTAGYTADEVAVLSGVLAGRLADATAAAATKAAAAAKTAALGIGLGPIERAYRLGLLSQAEFRARLAAAAIAPADVDILVGEVAVLIAADATARTKAAALAAAGGATAVSLAQETALVRAGIRTPAQFTAYLTGLGYSAADAADLASLVAAQAEVASDVAARRAAAAAKLAVTGLSLGQLQTAVAKGTLTIDQFAATLAAQGIAGDDLTILVLDTAAAAKISPPAGLSPPTGTP
jgi:hypothetical protein